MPAQDHGSAKAAEDRASLLAVRIVDRDDASSQLGHWRHAKGTVGDLRGAFLWPLSGGGGVAGPPVVAPRGEFAASGGAIAPHPVRDVRGAPGAGAAATGRHIPTWSWVFPTITAGSVGAGRTYTREDLMGLAGAAGEAGADGPSGKGGKGKAEPWWKSWGMELKKPKNIFAEANYFGDTRGGYVLGRPGPGIGKPVAPFGINVNRFGNFMINDITIAGHDPSNAIAVYRVKHGLANAKTGRPLNNKSSVAAWIQSAPEEKPIITAVRPVRDLAWGADTRYVAIRSSGPEGWPDFPASWYGLTVQAMNEDDQIELFHPTDPRLVIPHEGDGMTATTLLCDLEPETHLPDVERHARLTSGWRVVFQPTNSPGLHNSLAWNIGLSGNGDVRGGYVIDQPTDKGGRGARKRGPAAPLTKAGMDKTNPKVMGSIAYNAVLAAAATVTGFGVIAGWTQHTQPNRNRKGAIADSNARLRRRLRRGDKNLGRREGKSRALAMFGVMDGGPFDVGGVEDPHQIGQDGDGRPINQGHISTGALFRDRNLPAWDGPLLFEDEYKDGEDQGEIVRVHLGWNDGEEAWAWWSSTSISSSGGDDDGDPPPPPPPPGPPTGPTTPRDPGPPDPDPGPTTPGSDPGNPGGPKTPPPGTPRTGGGGGPTTGGGGGGGQETPEIRWPGINWDPVRGDYSPYARRTISLRRHYRAWAEHTFPVLTFQPGGPMRQGHQDFRNLLRPGRGAINERDHRVPVTARLEAFGAQGGKVGGPYLVDETGGTHAPGPWAYTQRPGRSRYLGGTGDGGIVFLPPEVDLAYSDEAFAPADAALSTTYVGVGPGARFFAGTPELAQGGVYSGFSWRESGAELVFASHDTAGAATDRITFRADGAVALGAPLEQSAERGITASTTQVQGQQPLTEGINYVETVGNANDAVTLPLAAAGKTVAVINDGVNTLQVFPASGDQIDGLAADASTSLLSGERAIFLAVDGVTWLSMVGSAA
jgi:hypothetical protein